MQHVNCNHHKSIDTDYDDGFVPTLGRKPVAAVVVIGDIGRSPRMCNHVISLAEQMDYEVDFIGYDTTPPSAQILDNPNIRVIPLREPPDLPVSLPESVRLAWRFLFNAIALFLALTLRVGLFSRHLDLILVQNPPGLPTLSVAWLAARLRQAKFVIDWHNYTWCMLACRWHLDISKDLDPNKKTATTATTPATGSSANSLLVDEPRLPRSRNHSRSEEPKPKKKKTKNSKRSFVEWCQRIEGFAGKHADASLCVSKAMREDLMARWEVPSAVFYDRPPSWKFRSVSLSEMHDLFLRLSESSSAFRSASSDASDGGEYTRFTVHRDGEVSRLPSRPLLLISSTSWTPDEDFSILLDAVIKYNDVVRVSRNSTAETTLPKLVLAITGKGPDKEMYQAKIERLQLESVDIHLPWLEADDYPVLLAAADLGVCLHTSTSGLDLPMKVVDMFGANIPVLAKRFNCISELVQDGKNGYLFDSSSQLCERIVELATGHPEHNKELHGLAEYVRGRGALLSWEEHWQSVAKQVFAPNVNVALARVLGQGYVRKDYEPDDSNKEE